MLFNSFSQRTVWQWEETQDNAKLTVQRNIYGMHAPMRLLMERKIVTSVGLTFKITMSFP